MQKNNCPTISIIIPCYNGELYLKEALLSLLNQSYYNWEAIIADNCSTDSSKEIILDFQEKDSRFHYIYVEKKGASAARNHAVKYATCDLLLFLDADDWLAENTVAEAVTYMTSHPTCKMFNLRSLWVNKQGNTVRNGFVYLDYKHCLVYGQDPKCVIRKSQFMDIGGFDEDMKKGFEDWEFFIRLLDEHSEVKVSENILYYYRVNKGENSVFETALANMEDVMKYIFKKNYDKYVSVLGAPQLIYQYQERKLPQITKAILDYRQKFINMVSRLVHLHL